MPLNTAQCKQFNEFLFRRTPDWDTKLSKDRFPYSYTYSGLYKTAPWEQGTGTEHTWDQVHVTRINDNGCWDPKEIGDCVGNPCNLPRNYTGWGSTRKTYDKFNRVYQTPPFCFDQLRDTEMAVQQLSAIVEGHKKLPDEIFSDYMRLWALRSGETIYIAGNADLRLTVSDSMFTNHCMRLDLGSANNLPTSKLTMGYLDNHIEELFFNGYFDQEFMPTGKFAMFTDIQTMRGLANANPALSEMYNAADFVKGGKLYAYGVMSGVGNWLFKIDPTPIRYQHIGNGVLERIQPFENVSATVGKKPEFSLAYKNAPYQRYHVYNPAARTVYLGDTSPVNPEMKFLARSQMGQWAWRNPDVIIYTDPNTGLECTLQNDLHNKGYFTAEFELGVKTEYPLIEMNIIAQREPQVIIDDPRCASTPSQAYQTLLPYNTLCGDPDLE